MTITFKTALATAAGLAVLAAPLAASAHRAWFAPTATNFSGDDPWVSVDAAISNDLFYPDHFPMQLSNVKAIGPAGEALKIENAVTGRYRSTFDVHLTAPGTTRVVTLNDGVQGTYVVDGKTYRIGGRRGGPAPAPGAAAPAPPPPEPGRPAPPLQGVADPSQIPANATEIKLVQTSSRNETFVTRGAPTSAKLTQVGLELAEAGVHPTDLVADEPAAFKLLMDGKPAGGVEVTIAAANQKFSAPLPEQKILTGADGVFKVNWPTAGFYWLSATATGPGTIPNATRRASYIATLEVQRP